MSAGWSAPTTAPSRTTPVPAVQPVRVSGGSSVGGLVGYLQTGSLRQYENGENFTVNGTGIRVGGIAGEARVGHFGRAGPPGGQHRDGAQREL